MNTKLPFLTMLLLISFASVNAVLFTPALPNITHFFGITEDIAQQTMTWFLIGYAGGQLIYGPVANRFGRKPALYSGISLQIISSLLGVLSGVTQSYWLLIIARFMMALGAGVGLKMTFTLVNECYSPQLSAQKISYLMLGFAITPGLGVALGGILNFYFGWMSCFYASAIYGLVLLVLTQQLPETMKTKDRNALQFDHLIAGYKSQFKTIPLVIGGLLMGTCTSFIYVFAGLAPFIAINVFKISSSQFGFYNCIPPMGLLLGSLASARLSKSYVLSTTLGIGLVITSLGCLGMCIAVLMNVSLVLSLFLPMLVIYFGLCFVMAQSSVYAMKHTTDKAHGAAVMSFINMGFATLCVFGLSYFSITILLLPLSFLALGIFMWVLWGRFILENRALNSFC